jgi:hypothetical protein
MWGMRALMMLRIFLFAVVGIAVFKNIKIAVYFEGAGIAFLKSFGIAYLFQGC